MDNGVPFRVLYDPAAAIFSQSLFFFIPSEFVRSSMLAGLDRFSGIARPNTSNLRGLKNWMFEHNYFGTVRGN